MKVVILAAGKGSRLSPLTDDKPKCLVEVNGKPIINYTINTLINMNIAPSDMIIITGYKEDMVKEYLSKLNCEFITQKKINGTANAIFLAKDYIDEDFIVLSGDIIYEKNDLMKLFQLRNSLLYTKQDERLYDYGTLDICHDRVMSINEKCTEPISNFINCAGYHFTPTVFNYIQMTLVDTRFGERIITNTINLMIKDRIWFTGIKIKELNEITYPDDIKKVEDRLNQGIS